MLAMFGLVLEKQNTSKAKVSAPTPAQEEKIGTSDWLTYRDEELGISFKYPISWKIKKESDGSITFRDKNDNPKPGDSCWPECFPKATLIAHSTTTKDLSAFIDKNIGGIILNTKLQHPRGYTYILVKDAPGMLMNDEYFISNGLKIAQFDL